MTPAPTATTTPANSCPSTSGARAPVSGCGTDAGINTGPLSHSSRSVPQIPHHLTRSCSSPGPGGAGGGTSSTRTSPRACHRTASISAAPLRPLETGNLRYVAQLTQAGCRGDQLVARAEGEVRQRGDGCPGEQHHADCQSATQPRCDVRQLPGQSPSQDGQDPVITNIMAREGRAGQFSLLGWIAVRAHALNTGDPHAQNFRIRARVPQASRSLTTISAKDIRTATR